ncbi:MAG TPA: UPF0182 family protein [Actinomycetota bacterium]|nr:UPF0182 family protein [Actinomycetota bacterium]
MRASERRRRPRPGLFVAAFFVLFLASGAIARFYTDVLWFREVGFDAVLWTSLGSQFGLAIAVGLAAALVVWANMKLADVLSPAYRVGIAGRPDPFDRYREMLGPFVGWLRLGVALFTGLSIGLTAGAGWQTFLLWRNRVPFGQDDPQFGKDIAFYVFELPFLDQAVDWLWAVVVASLITSLAAHYFHGSIRPEAGIKGFSSGAMAHISVLLGLLALLKAAQYWLGQYQLNFSPRGQVTGASYTDVHAQLPALKLLMAISILSAVLFLLNIWFRRYALPLAAVGLWVIFSIVAGGLWPFAVQRFSVDPQELQRERPFIARNLAATREAFGVDDVESRPFAASTDLTAEEVRANTTLFENIRLWDPEILKLAYEQLQAIRTYYQFEDVDIDRYEIGGEPRQVLLSARELSIDNLPENSRTWSNEHLQFTHGFGLVASLANARTSAGQPSFLVKDVPGTVIPEAETLEADQPRLYYGESYEPGNYSIVDSRQDELDYPTQDSVERSNYEGRGGITVGGPLRRVAFALREGDPNLVLSSLITSESRILIYRNVRDRVLRAAPFLSLDEDAYPAVVDGRVVWIIDAYTSTPFYPYSQRFVPAEVLEGAAKGMLAGPVNYVRNSVKVVVDAYDGTMDFYVVDDEDPLIAAWQKVFPDLFTAGEPSDDLRAHFRYPEDLFAVQSEVFLTYHMNDPDDFYAKEDAWEVPNNPGAQGSMLAIERPARVPPTYLLLQLPGETEHEFVLSRPFTPRARNNMIALMVARSDPENYGEFIAFEFPSGKQVPGPIQVDNAINQDVEISQTLSLLRQGGSEVDFGSLVNLPVEDSILYVQPLFVTAENVGIPELKRVILALGADVVMEESFEAALATLFDLDAEPEPDDPEEPPVDPGDDPEPVGDLQALIQEAADLYERAQEALAAGDFETYGRLIEELGEVLTEAAQTRP